jgi:broad specificity phosphatase PhoE
MIRRMRKRHVVILVGVTRILWGQAWPERRQHHPAAELDELRELNVGRLDGRSDAQAWDAYSAVLAAWAAGQGSARFPGGEDYAELWARLRHAMVTVASRPGESWWVFVVSGGLAARSFKTVFLDSA